MSSVVIYRSHTKNTMSVQIQEPISFQIPTQRESLSIVQTPLAWSPTEQLTCNPLLNRNQLNGYDVNPVADRNIFQLGAVCLRNVWLTGDGSRDDPLRRHRLYTMSVEGYRHALELTDPAEGKDAAFVVVSMPGYSEHIEGGVRADLHRHLAEELPDARIVSIASDGIGNTGDRYSYADRRRHGLAGMAASRLLLSRITAGNKPVIFQGTSMGSVISLLAAHRNETVSDGREIDLAGQVWLSSAIIPPSNINRDMLLKFAPQLTVHFGTDVLLHTNPIEQLQLLARARHTGMHVHDMMAMQVQAQDLFKGTPPEILEQTLGTGLKTEVINGQKDCLAQPQLFEAMLSRQPANLRMHIVPKHGHELGFKPAKAAAKLAKSVRHIMQQ